MIAISNGQKNLNSNIEIHKSGKKYHCIAGVSAFKF